MLQHLYIKNVALIDEITIDFESGLNILTGETGAGKSMIIDSINFALGERISKDFIRSGEDSALVEVLFKIHNKLVSPVLEEFGIEMDEDQYLLISRGAHQNGKTITRVNGRTVTVGMLKQISEVLIDIHGQHEHQSLLNPSKHIGLLDQFCGGEMLEKKSALSELYQEYRHIQQQIQALSGDERERAQRIDLLQFQVEEIGQARLKEGEEEQLLGQRKVLANSEKLIHGMDEIYGLLQEGVEEALSVSDAVGRACTLLQDLSAIDEALKGSTDLLETVSVQVEDVIREIRHYKDQLDHDPQELYEVETRLDLIYGLKRKYGSSIQEILTYYQSIQEQLEFIQNSEEELQKLLKQKGNIEEKIRKLCGEISSIRKSQGGQIQSKIEEILHELEMKKAIFAISFDQKEQFTENGWDKVEFMISPNAGEALKPLAKIASGGEMSRVMLALKTVLADVDGIETLIFDEIDTGVSGRTAQKVAEKLSFIGRHHQVLCITHLPQIASMADQHYVIEKTSEQAKTTTTIYPLTYEKSIEELSRLIGGAIITDTTIKTAQEMKMMAREIKHKYIHNIV